MSHDTRELVELFKASVKFANAAAGEGIEIDGLAPDDFMMRYSDATGFEDWDNLGAHVADALTSQAERIEKLEAAIAQAAVPLEGLTLAAHMTGSNMGLCKGTWDEINNAVQHIRAAISDRRA